MKEQADLSATAVIPPIVATSRSNGRDDIITVGELASTLRCHPATIYRLVKQKKLPGFRVGFDWRFSRQAIEKWIAGQHL